MKKKKEEEEFLLKDPWNLTLADMFHIALMNMSELTELWITTISVEYSEDEQLP